MSILDKIINNEPSEKGRLRLEQIWEFAELGCLLEGLYDDVKRLKPSQLNPILDLERLDEIVKQAFDDFIEQEILHIDTYVRMLTIECLFRMREVLIEEYEEFAIDLEEHISLMLIKYNRKGKEGESKLVNMQNCKLPYATASTNEIEKADENHKYFVCEASEAKKEELDWRVKQSKCLGDNAHIKRILRNRYVDVVYNCPDFRKDFVVWLIHELVDRAKIIKVSEGKCIWEVTAQYLRFGNTIPTANQLSKRCCKIKKNKEKFHIIVEEVQKIIDAVAKVE